jgi:Rap1a immunity proteins
MRQGSLAATAIVTAALAVWLVSIVPLEAADNPGFGLDDFQLDSGQDLLDICTLDRSSASYWEAQAFCFGYFQGGADFHRALAAGPGFKPIACPAPEATIRDAVAVFVAYARAHPEQLDQAPMDVVFHAVSERWPCP